MGMRITHTYTHQCCQRLFPVRRQTLTCHKWRWRKAGRREMHTLMCVLSLFRTQTHIHTHIKNTPTYCVCLRMNTKPSGTASKPSPQKHTCVRSCICKQTFIPIPPSPLPSEESFKKVFKKKKKEKKRNQKCANCLLDHLPLPKSTHFPHSPPPLSSASPDCTMYSEMRVGFHSPPRFGLMIVGPLGACLSLTDSLFFK